MEADASIQDEIHYLVLDFLAYQATESLLASLKSSNEHNQRSAFDESVEKHLELFDCKACCSLQVWQKVDNDDVAYFTFCAPSLSSNSQISTPFSTILRVQLLQFAVSYDSYREPSRASSRFSKASLAKLRSKDQKRAALWWEQRDEVDPDWVNEEMSLGKGIMAEMAAKEIAQDSYNDSQPKVTPQQHEAGPTLCDLIPAFMKLTLTRMELMARNEMSSGGESETLSVRSQWLYLAAEMMLQACLDDISSVSSYNGSVQTRMHDIFSWGFLQTSFGGPSASVDPMDVDSQVAVDTKHAQVDGKHRQSEGPSDDEGDSTSHPNLQQLITLNGLFRESDPGSSDKTDEQDTECSKSWESIRKNHMMLIPDILRARKRKRQARALAGEMARLEEDHSQETFHKSLVEFLDSLMASIAPPLLEQLESTNDDQDIWIEELNVTSEESARLRAIARSFR